MRLIFIIALSINSVLFLTGCNDERTTDNNTSSAKSNQTLVQNDTLTLLSYGESKPTLYKNAEEIIEKKYSIKFKDLGSCSVNMKTKDSIKKNNELTFIELEKKFGKDIDETITNEVNAEYAYLIDLDDYLRKTQKSENVLILIYFVKKQNRYKAYYLFGLPSSFKNDGEIKYRLKCITEVDSATKNIISKSIKDELIPFKLRNLQYD